MTEEVASPDAYFDKVDLVESAVLHAEQRGDGFLLVFVYAAERVTAWLGERRRIPFRDMRRLRFAGVSGFTFTPTARRFPTWSTIDRATPGVPTISGLTYAHDANSPSIELVLASIGVVSFRFESLFETRRAIVAQQLPDGETAYVDRETGVAVEFEHPFGAPPWPA